MMWWIKHPERLAVELEAIEDLQANEPWLVRIREALLEGLIFAVEFDINVNSEVLPFVLWGAPSLLGHGLRENPMSPGGGGMVRSRQVKGAGSAPTEGARRATGVGADAAAMGSGALAPGQRWSASRKRDVVLRLLRSEPLDAVSREVGVEVYRLERWKVRALAGLERGLKEQAGEPLAAELDAAKRHIGELSMDNELLRSRARAAERRLPLATRRSRR